MSSLPFEVKDHVENILVYLTRWDTDDCPWNQVGRGWPHEHTSVRWQLMVEILYRLLTCDLLRSTNYCEPEDWMPTRHRIPDTAQVDYAFPVEQKFNLHFAQEMASVDPFMELPVGVKFDLNPGGLVSSTERSDVDHGQRLANVWIGPLLWATDKTRNLLARHNIDDYGQTHQGFFDELEAMFEQYGVPWGEQPLIPIKPSSD